MPLQVVLAVRVEKLEDKTVFEKHLKKEGFTPIEGEEFFYTGESSTTVFQTKAYILEVVSKGLQKTSFAFCSIMFQIGNNDFETYKYDESQNFFVEVK